MDKPQTQEISDLQQSITLPADIQITEYLGKGARAHVFKAIIGQDNVIAKIYRKPVVQKYRDKYGVDIAEFEYQRNQLLYELTKIKKYIAKPYRVYPWSSEYTHCMIQEHLAGKTLKAVIAECGCLPEEVRRAGYEIVKQAENHGIHDLDISWGNIIVIDEGGELIPKLYDFNLIPQHVHPPNPFLGIALRLGMRGKSHRDYRNLKKWERHGKEAAPRSA